MKKLLVTYAWLILLFLYLPLLVLAVYSFNDSRINAEWNGFTLHWYADLLQDPAVLEAFLNSLSIAAVTTLAATAIGTACALGLHRYKQKWRSAFGSLLYLPVLVPDILMGLSLLVLFSQAGMELGKLTIIIAHITFSISFVVIIVSARLAGMGRELEEAAGDLGAAPWQTFRYVTLPVLLPGVLSAALLTFTLSIDDFVITFFVAGPGSTTLPIYIYGMVKRGITPEINALSTLLIVLIALLMLGSEWLRRRGENGEKGGLPL
ncbi:ABC transporter permease [Ectobacillus ponti]|uniref:ABC transporter permease n=1 Tax=Ectobacillus ponti TaxID=2961894 RepID=A0AA42BNX6_9BACI|nr:ABC transporter permease [Ectobacillus ponti]MCP8968470.1 ABC transporter permease [Ectobacillus ponti]